MSRESLTDAYNQGRLESCLYSHWARKVPSYFNAADPAFEAEAPTPEADVQMLKPLEQFIFQSESSEFVAELQKKCPRNKRTICGRVFRNGEPHYSCRDCSLDPTCVLCGECFKSSAHRNHRYKMGASSGGGCCDCGDEEAWKSEPHCADHLPSQHSQEREEPVLPGDVRERASALFSVLIPFMEHCLNVEESAFPPQGGDSFLLNPKEEYCMVLYNDELHTFDQVIDALKRSLLCDSHQARQFASFVDREGRHSIIIGTKARCEEVKAKIDRSISRAQHGMAEHRVKPLHSMIVTVRFCQLQFFAQKLLKWLTNFVLLVDELSELLCDLLLKADHSHPKYPGTCYLDRALMNDTKLWKSVRIQWHTLFMKTFLLKYEHKKMFACYFIKHYEKIQMEFSQDDHHHQVSISSMAVQIFTVPSIARDLIVHHDALRVVIAAILNTCTQPAHPGGSGGRLQLNIPTFKNKLTKYVYCFWNLKYLLHSELEDWDDQARNCFIGAFKGLLQFLACIQNMDGVVRETKLHVEVEPEWEPAVRVQMYLGDVIRLMTRWAGSDDEVLAACIQATSEVIVSEHIQMPVEQKSVNNVRVNCIKQPVESTFISIHQQIHRMLAGLLCVSMEGERGNRPLEMPPGLGSMTPLDLMEPCLRVIVLASQVSAQMWRRNGYSLPNQVSVYMRTRARSEMYERDVTMLQLAFCMTSSLSPDQLLVAVLHKFHASLPIWFDRNFVIAGATGREDPSESLKLFMALLEDFFHLVIIILTERHSLLSQCSKQQVQQYELIHVLLQGPIAHSKLVHKLNIQSEELTELEANLREVATFREGPHQKKLLHLKPEKRALFNPMCFHLTRSELAAIEDSIFQANKAAGLPQVVPPPDLPPVKPGLRAGIYGLLGCGTLSYMIYTVLHRAAYSLDRFYSDDLAYRALYLIAVGMKEELAMLRSDIEGADQLLLFADHCINYCPRHFTETMLQVMDTLFDHPTRLALYKPLITWIKETYSQISQIRHPVPALPGPSAASGTVETPCSPSDEGSSKKAKLMAKSERAKRTREKILAQMAAAREKFNTKHEAELDTFASESSNTEPMESGELPPAFPVVLGPHRTEDTSLAGQTQPPKYTCILCQEESALNPDDTDVLAPPPQSAAGPPAGVNASSVDVNSKVMVQIGLVQKSSMFAQNGARVTLDDGFNPLFPSANLAWASLASSCGHLMHFSCWQQYFNRLVEQDGRHRPGLPRMRKNLGFSLERGEFLCPMCETLSNVTLPLIPLNTVLSSSRPVAMDQSQYSHLIGHFKQLVESGCDGGVLAQWLRSEPSEKLNSQLKNAIRHAAELIYVKGLEVNPDDRNVRIPIVTWNCLVSTIYMQEFASRFAQKSLFDPSLKLETVECLGKLSRLLPSSYSDDILRHFTLLATALFSKFDARSFLNHTDLFSYMAYMCLSVVAVHHTPDSVKPNLHLIHHFMLTHFIHLFVTQVLIKFALRQTNPENHKSHAHHEEHASSDSEPVLRKIYKLICSKCKLDEEAIEKTMPTHSELLTRLEVCLLPFLRSAALLFHALHMVPVPDQLTKDCSNLELLCQYLGLESDLDVLVEPVLEALAYAHPLSPYVVQMCESTYDSVEPDFSVHYPVEPRQLVHLPDDFSDLINQPPHMCPSTNDVMKSPALCLVCGEVMCSGSYCCQSEHPGFSGTRGAATTHVLKCTGGVGIFLRYLDCEVVLIGASGRGCFYPAPYVDEYGETDNGLKRGNPLHLNRVLYDKLKLMWLEQSVSQTVSRTTVLHTSLRNLAFDWNEM